MSDARLKEIRRPTLWERLDDVGVIGIYRGRPICKWGADEKPFSSPRIPGCFELSDLLDEIDRYADADEERESRHRRDLIDAGLM